MLPFAICLRVSGSGFRAQCHLAQEEHDSPATASRRPLLPGVRYQKIQRNLEVTTRGHDSSLFIAV